MSLGGLSHQDLRPHVDRLVGHVLGGKNALVLEKVSSIATDCVVAGLNEETTAGKQL